MSTSGLDRIEPLVGLLLAAPDPRQSFRKLASYAAHARPDAAIAMFDDAAVARSCLRYADVLTADGHFTAQARDRLIQLDVLLELRGHSTSDRWKPVVTVPTYLREILHEGQVAETEASMRRVISAARERLIVSSPFLDSGFEPLASRIATFVANGGTCLLLTRDVTATGEPRNRRAVENLYRKARERGGPAAAERVDLVSWEEHGLGMHMKVLIADGSTAYVGSANLTWGGLGDHAEVGVLLEGPSVAGLQRLIVMIAETIRARHGYTDG